MQDTLAVEGSMGNRGAGVLLVGWLLGALATTASCGGTARTMAPPPVVTESSARAGTLCDTGREHLARREYAAAAEWLDRCIEADPTQVYAYYDAGMAYREIQRIDLMTIRLERFLQLAPEAPERPRVEAILRSARGR